MTQEEKPYKIICPNPECGSSNTILHDNRNDVRRHYCKDCKKAFTPIKKRVNYSSKEKAFLSMLVNFLNADGNKRVSIKQAIADINEEVIDINKFQLTQRVSTDSKAICCYNPRLLICEDGEDIVMYRIEQRADADGASRPIGIVDHDKYSKHKEFIDVNSAPLKTGKKCLDNKNDKEYRIKMNKRS